jgi:hypothetical protein
VIFDLHFDPIDYDMDFECNAYSDSNFTLEFDSDLGWDFPRRSLSKTKFTVKSEYE